MQYSELKDGLEQYAAEKINANDLKHVTAPYGIYQQRNDAVMTRIRLTGGHIDVQKLHMIADIMDRNAVGYAHLTTRQDVQLHDVPLTNVHQVVAESTAAGLPFKGGGGNTFRNILVNPDSGIGPGSVFDVMPYALGLRDVVFACDQAFALPRKLKIGFVDRPELERMAAVQDLGFIAVMTDGKRGFTVYGGGGMGRNSALGVKLFDFLPEEDLSRCALAMTEMFFDHGDRNNRGKARIRYIVDRLGREGFAGLFHDYYRKKNVENKLPSYNMDLPPVEKQLKKNDCEPVVSADLEYWTQLAVSPTLIGEDVVSVRIFVPNGNLNSEQLRKLGELAELTGCPFVRLMPGQDILLPLVHRSILPDIFIYLKNKLSEIDLTLNSFKGHIVSCVGSTVCKIGILDAPQAAAGIAAELDAYFADRQAGKARLARRIIADIRISGCPNSCSGHPSAAVGWEGRKSRFESEAEPAYQFYTGASMFPASLSQAVGEPVRAADVPARTLQMIIDEYSGETQ